MAMGSAHSDDPPPTPYDPQVPPGPYLSQAPTPSNMAGLLDARLRRHIDRSEPQPALLILGFEPDRVEILRRDDATPEDALIGFVLPERFQAIGVIADSVVARRSVQGHQHAALAIAASRGGETLTRIATEQHGVVAATHPQGWVLDACQRTLGLATAPIAAASVELPLTIWLDRLMVDMIATSDPEPVTWARAMQLCPVPDRWRSADPAHLGATLAATVPSWSSMRRLTGDGAPGPLAIKPSWARWMDDGMFGRWCLGYFPELASLRADVEFLAPPNVAALVGHTVVTALTAADFG